MGYWQIPMEYLECGGAEARWYHLLYCTDSVFSTELSRSSEHFQYAKAMAEVGGVVKSVKSHRSTYQWTMVNTGTCLYSAV